MALQEKWKNWFRKDNLLILILSGVLLFIITLPIEKEGTDKEQQQTLAASQSPEVVQQPSEEDFATELEKQLEAILVEMSGVGRVKVMITLQSSEELVVEKDEPVSRSNTNESDSVGGSRIVTQVDSAESTVYVTDGGESRPYVVKTLFPRVEGVVVVAQGAGDGTVNQNITELVQALFDVEAHKVKVVKMASSN